MHIPSKYRWLLRAGIKDEERNDSQTEYSTLIHLIRRHQGVTALLTFPKAQNLAPFPVIVNVFTP